MQNIMQWKQLGHNAKCYAVTCVISFAMACAVSFMNDINLSRLVTKQTKWHVRPAKTQISLAKTQISLGIRPLWSESSLSAWSNIGSSATH